MFEIFLVAQLGGQTEADPLSLILNLLFFLLIFTSMFYGQKIQSWKAAKTIEGALAKLKKWNDECKIHGKVKGKPDIRIKLVVDDGTGAVGANIGRELTEKILGKTFEECKKLAESSKDGNALIDEMNKLLFAQRINVQGNALGDNFGTTIIAKEIKLVDVDINGETERLFQGLEELQ